MATACNPLQGASSRADQRKPADLGVDAPGKVLSLVCRYFLISVGSILLITGAAKIYSALGSARLLDTWDPIFGPSLGLTFRHLLFLVGVLELLLAYGCMFQRVTQGVGLYLVVCLAVVCFVYRTGLSLVNWQGACPCLGRLSDALRISPEGVDRMMKGVLAYMFVGGFALSALWVRHRRRTRRAARTQALSAGSIALFISVGMYWFSVNIPFAAEA